MGSESQFTLLKASDYWGIVLDLTELSFHFLGYNVSQEPQVCKELGM